MAFTAGAAARLRAIRVTDALNAIALRKLADRIGARAIGVVQALHAIAVCDVARRTAAFRAVRALSRTPRNGLVACHFGVAVGIDDARETGMCDRIAMRPRERFRRRWRRAIR